MTTASSDYSMHPLENITVSTSASEAGLSHAVPRYSGEPDPFKHATDVSQCVTCGAQITVRQSRNNVQKNLDFILGREQKRWVTIVPQLRQLQQNERDQTEHWGRGHWSHGEEPPGQDQGVQQQCECDI